MDLTKGCRQHLQRGSINRIARLSGVNVHTVRLWVNHGMPTKSKLQPERWSELVKCIIAEIEAIHSGRPE